MNQPIIVVSGLPRSGTSMMMQMLQAGGLALVEDGVRKADIDNPRGYYEDERVKSLREDSSWLNEQHGKVVKIISVLLYHLPPTNRYKIVFMERHIHEILKSQKKMMQGKKQEPDDVDDETMAEKMEDHLRRIKRWIKGQRNIEYLFVNFKDIIADPVANANRVARFLDVQLDAEAMANSTDRTLYRNRIG